MTDTKDARTLVDKGSERRARKTASRPGLLLAWQPPGLASDGDDRAPVGASLTVGRGEGCGLRVGDPRLSGEHFRIRARARSCEIEDLASTNGTWLDGHRLRPGQPRALPVRALIRAGESVLVFEAAADELLDDSLAGEGEQLGMAGRFHVAPMLRQVKEAALSRRPPLITGPSGVGKELAARALAKLWGASALVRHNVSASSPPEEMSRALFGVAPKAFTGVAASDGLLVSCAKDGAALFLDEIHNLSAPAQSTLLTVIEDKRFSRKGAEDTIVEADVRLVFASNSPDEIKDDLKARLWRVSLGSLRERLADVPRILTAVLGAHLAAQDLDPTPVLDALDGDLVHELCLRIHTEDLFGASNVRGLTDMADRVAARHAAGTDATASLDTVFDELLVAGGLDLAGDADAASQYEEQRELLSAVYLGCGKNAKLTVELVKRAGFPWSISRRHLTRYLEQWGVK